MLCDLFENGAVHIIKNYLELLIHQRIKMNIIIFKKKRKNAGNTDQILIKNIKWSLLRDLK